MSAYLIEVDDTKDGICYPTIVGPFSNGDKAAEFAEKFGMGKASEFQGGYSEVHVIDDDACDYTPDRYRDAFIWRLETA